MSDLCVVLVSSFPPRRCGIGTFSNDLARAMGSAPGVGVHVIAIEPKGESFAYGRNVIARISQDDPASYVRAAETAGRWGADVICIQHEFGLWGIWGDEGLEADFATPLIEAASSLPRPIPVVTTLHTIRPHPRPYEKKAVGRIVELSAATIVMARTGAMILSDDYGVPLDRLVRIPHGVPVVESQPRRFFKRRLGLEGRTIISTFGLLDPRKGIEYMIRAMRRVVEKHPEALYLVVGETHPELRKYGGESYRNSLLALVSDLELHEHVRFVNQYLDDHQVIDYLQASDVYVTPYLDRHQITSGTLAFAVGTGKAIVSTPYPHATEALAEGRGLLSEFRSADSLTQCLMLMLDYPETRAGWEARTKEYGRRDSWPLVGERYTQLFRRVAAGLPYGDMLAIKPEPLPKPPRPARTAAASEVRERELVPIG